MEASGGPSRKELILCIGGAFNPVHSRHVLAMVKAKQWLEANTEYIVLAGVLAVAPDGYVSFKSRKLGYKCVTAEHRIKMCELACFQHKDWLKPYPRPVGSAAEAGKKTKTEMTSSEHPDLHIAVLVGADRAMNRSGFAKWHKASSILTVCIGRKGETSKIKEQFEKDKIVNKVNNLNFYLIPDELDNVSSTEVRKRLEKMDDADLLAKKQIIDSLIMDGWICEGQGDYILQHEAYLYM